MLILIGHAQKLVFYFFKGAQIEKFLVFGRHFYFLSNFDGVFFFEFIELL
jgi:hypothetical protein